MSDKKMQVVFASAEAAPFVKTGGLGDVAGSLPRALVAAGADVIVMVPKYGTIASEYTDRMEHVADFYVSLGWRNEYCGLERLVIDGVTYLFIDNERYFKRDYPYGFFDDGERFAFFSKAVTESLQHLPEGFQCDVLHCNDWHTALAPVFLREFYQGLPLYERVKTVFSIHNIAFQGQYADTILNDILGMAHIPNAARQLRCDERSINYMQGALDYSDAITTVSPSYAWEIQTPEYGEGLDGILRRRSNVLSGILNGIDTDAWNPATDPMIHANYSAADMSGKKACKAALQEELGLEVRDDRPLMVMVTRLTRQKGMDLVTYALDRILSGGVQVAVLGTGDYEEPMRYFANKYPGTCAARITFDNALSHRMYAGADMFLMPSLFEPCGLSQMIAMRYGTLPVVRETGGLRDTVAPYNQFTGEGTGFTFANFNGDEMGDAVFRGARLYWDDHAAWDHLVQNAMAADFSWVRSADEYMNLYHNLHPEIDITKPEPVVQEPEPAEPTAAEAEPAAAPAPEPTATKAEPAPKAEQAAEPADDAKAEAPAKAEESAPKAEPVAEPAKKTAAKKTTASKTAAKKPAARKTAATKSTTAKAAEKPAAKATATKPAASKAAATKPAASKAAATKTAASKTTAAKATATKATAAKTTAKKPSTASAAKTAAKSTATKAAPAKAAASKTAADKPATAAATAPKATSTKTAPKAAAAKTAPAKASTSKAATSSAAKATAKPAAPKATAAKAAAPKAAAQDSSAATPADKPAPKAKSVSAAKRTTRKR
ncbi:MAG TPA: glycogen synthase GlgA [Enorma massiliensis]|uniref:glycogen synthase GlgA n=1 Tax=Enorma massiliensis TaxID=1472761 RepID=UPI001D584C7D|nr:glycogen synthase GlgA [Enorma massiliensis]HJG61372.1 glycogen synthase GlgA [Enorma massiliensis]